MSTPWGQIDHTEHYETGISFVSTPGHGGLRIARKYAESHLSTAAINAAIDYGSYLYYEEDCNWCIPAWELPHLWPALFQYGNKKTEDIQRNYLRDSIRFWNVKYAIESGLISDGDKFYCGNYKDNCDDGILAARVDVTGMSWVCDTCGKVIA